MTPGPLSLISSRMMLRSRAWPRHSPYQANSARSDVPQVGSSSSRKVRRLERILRMATRLWWIRSDWVHGALGAVELAGRRLGPHRTGLHQDVQRPHRLAPFVLVDQFVAHVVQQEGAGRSGQYPVQHHAGRGLGEVRVGRRRRR